jgi:FMN phosphatase YigB (HAD superfamily)
MKTIAWDVDDTLNDFTSIWFNEWWLLKSGNETLSFSQLVENPPSRLLKVSDSEYLASIDAFRISKVAARVYPNGQVLQWFQKYGEKVRNIALTAIPLFAAPLSAAWVMKYYGKWIRSYNVLPSARYDNPMPVYDQNKTEFLKWFGKVDILIEDNAMNLQSAKLAGFATIGIPQPWNKIGGSLTDALIQLTDFIQG